MVDRSVDGRREVGVVVTGGKPPAWDEARRATGERAPPANGGVIPPLGSGREVDDRHCRVAGLYFARVSASCVGFDGRQLQLAAPAIDVAQQLVLACRSREA